MDEKDDHKYDLPLMANSHEIQIKHYFLDLSCDIDRKSVEGSIYMILEPVVDTDLGHRFDITNKEVCKSSVTTITKQKSSNKDNITSVGIAPKPFTVTLDSRDISYSKAEEVLIESEKYKEIVSHINNGKEGFSSNSGTNLIKQLRTFPKSEISFHNEDWCLKIWKEGITKADEFPQILKITYQTTQAGASLRWATDQDGNPCMYSAAMWINNRSLIPCQEYDCFSTWQAWVTVPSSYMVLMSGDADELVTDHHEGEKVEFYYYCSMLLPSFTLALAIGKWSCYKPVTETREPITDCICHHSPACDISFCKYKTLPWRIFAPSSMLQKAVEEFSPYIDACTQVIQEILGPSPFPRMDIVIYPSCSQDMAMANPSLLFLSQSMLCGDQSICIKLAHEISHYWFGLLIGAKDWTEEWLSEGFATFIEDIIHARVMKWSEKEYKERSELRALLKYHTLSAELENTQEDLQTLRPNQGDDPNDNCSSVMYVKNGINPKKLFTQVHYLKGYFLLRYLCEAVGVNEFTVLLKDYIVKYHGHMVLSQDFIKLVVSKFPKLSEQGITEEYIYKEWLDVVGMPKALLDFEASLSNSLYTTVICEVQKWKNYNKRRCKMRGKKARKIDEIFATLDPDQQVLLLELLLNEKKLAQGTLTLLKKTYNLGDEGNPDVRHRWCELVIKFKCSPYYNDVKYFLLHDQAMGVYLYGELIISRCKKQREIAEDCFKMTSKEMESGTRQTVEMMIYGTST